MNKRLIVCLLVLLPGCDFIDVKRNSYDEIRTIEKPCFYCDKVPTIEYKYKINESESLKFDVCEFHSPYALGLNKHKENHE